MLKEYLFILTFVCVYILAVLLIIVLLMLALNVITKMLFKKPIIPFIKKCIKKVDTWMDDLIIKY